MFRKLRDQAERLGVSINTMRGLLRQGLPFAQVETGSIYISDDAISEFFRSREKSLRPKQTREAAEAIARKVL